MRFLKSLGDDFKEAFFKHWLRLVGFLVCYLGPLVMIMAFYVTRIVVEKPATSAYEGFTYSVPLFVWPALAFLFVFYWKSLRKKTIAKVASLRSENSINGKHYALIIIFDFLDKGAVVCFLAFMAWLFQKIAEMSIGAVEVFEWLAVIEAVGGLFYVLDDIVKGEPK